MSKENRINITPLARRLKEGELNASWRPSYRPTGELLELFSKVKPELYVLTAVFIDRIVERVLELRNNRPPFGLLKNNLGSQNNSCEDEESVATYKDIAGGFPFVRLGLCMNYTLGREVNQEIKEVKSGKSLPYIETVYRRLENLVKLVREEAEKIKEENWIMSERYRSVDSFVTFWDCFCC